MNPSVHASLRRQAGHDVAAPLTAAEERIESLMREGRNYKHIAEELRISLGTARRHGSNLLKKTCGRRPFSPA